MLAPYSIIITCYTSESMLASYLFLPPRGPKHPQLIGFRSHHLNPAVWPCSFFSLSCSHSVPASLTARSNLLAMFSLPLSVCALDSSDTADCSLPQICNKNFSLNHAMLAVCKPCSFSEPELLPYIFFQFRSFTSKLHNFIFFTAE